MANVDLFLDATCPWSFLALVRLRDATDRNATGITLKPVSAQELLKTENPQLSATHLAEHPAKAAWQLEDIQCWAAMWGLNITIPEGWPVDGTLAGAAIHLAAADCDGYEYALAVFRRYFSTGDALTVEVLAETAAGFGLDEAGFTEALSQGDALAPIQANTHELIRRGGFGIPTMFVGDQLFFGNDRVPLVEWSLGPISEASFVMPGQHGKL